VKINSKLVCFQATLVVNLKNKSFFVMLKIFEGPMKKLSDNRLIGIISNGHGCALKDYPGIYTNVAAVRDWIIETAKIE
jgi:hypothetical protein